MSETEYAKPGATFQWTLTAYGLQVVEADLPDVPGKAKWYVGSMHCPRCDHAWHMNAPVGWWGVECPRCGYVDFDYQHGKWLMEKKEEEDAEQ